jgi:aryl-alcohol dehydrogenase-like predicted oxidoreductase
MSTVPTVLPAGSFSIDAALSVQRLGYGAMRITGRGVWGEPADRGEALRTLRRLPDLGINFIDTADSYGPDVSELLLREALHPYTGMLVATKAGLLRTGPDCWAPLGRPEYLQQQAKMSCRHLGVEQLGLWQLHRIDPQVPAGEQFDAIKSLLADGLIGHAGLSEVTVAEIKAAQKYFRVATVQNRYNLIDRGSEAVLKYCTAQGIGFIPWFPLAAGELARPGSIVEVIARSHGATPGQVALAWLLQKSPVMLPIPGTSKVRHLEENAAAAALQLSADECAQLEHAQSAARP